MTNLVERFDLNSWKLGLPVDKNGGTTGVAAEVYNITNYQHPDYFYFAGERLVFTAMAEGATTKGSHYARSELREMDGNKVAAWTLKDGGTMTATLRVTDIPTRNDGTPGKMVIGQIHGKDDELVRLYWSNGKIYFANDQSGSDGKEHDFKVRDANGNEPDISLGEDFSYKINVTGNVLTVEIFADGKTYSSVTKILDVWNTDKLYFKAGVYLGINETNGSGVGQAEFSAIDFSHKPGEGLDAWRFVSPSTVLDPPHSDSFYTLIDGDVNANHLIGGNGADQIKGNAGDDVISGGNGDDQLLGGDGQDRLIGGKGADWLKGGAGNDVFVYHNINEAGDVIVDFDQGDKIDLTLLAQTLGLGGATLTMAGLRDNGFFMVKDLGNGLAELYIDSDGKAGSNGWVKLATVGGNTALLQQDDAFIVSGTATSLPQWQNDYTNVITIKGAQLVYGTAQNDWIIGSDLNDRAFGGAGDDKMDGGAGDDRLFGGDGNDQLFGGVGNDYLGGGEGHDRLSAGDGNDVVMAGNGNDWLMGAAGNDSLTGNNGDDLLWGGDGNDRLQGGAGKDWLNGGAGTDVFVFTSLSEAGDVIADFGAGDKIDLSSIVAQLKTADKSWGGLVEAGILKVTMLGSEVSALYFDKDGAGSGAAVLVAQVHGDLLDNANDFIL